MTLSRREFLHLAGVVAAGATIASCAPIYQEVAKRTSAQVPPGPIPLAGFSGLRRLTYGPTVEERIFVARNGLAAWIEEQLAPESIADSGANWQLRSNEVMRQDADVLAGWEREEVTTALKQGTLLRKIYSRSQLYELMVEFWTNHFNISVAKGDCWFLKVIDDREVIRPHALGNFGDLLWASAHSPAMLVYLDNQANDKHAPNENYARELMELHTLGVNGGYTQNDVMELARCFTGWTVKEHFWRGQFTFDEALHDDGDKIVRGIPIQAAGIAEAQGVLKQLANDSATARFIVTKLVQRLIEDHPDTEFLSLVSRGTATFLRTKGDIRSTLRTILLDGLVARSDRLPPKFKRPIDFVTSALRMTRAETDAGEPIILQLGRMGQSPFEWPTPDGPPTHAAAWTGNLLPRWQFALSLATNQIPNTRVSLPDLLGIGEGTSPEDALSQLCELLLGGRLSPSVETGLKRSFAGLDATDTGELAMVITAGLLASPAFQVR